MIVGIGIDLVDIHEIERLVSIQNGVFLRRTYTDRERVEAKKAVSSAEYLATRFAAKEAVFKAVAHHTASKSFDFRIVETLSEADGYPVIRACDELRTILEEAGIDSLFVSLSTEGEYAIAMVVAESRQ